MGDSAGRYGRVSEVVAREILFIAVTGTSSGLQIQILHNQAVLVVEIQRKVQAKLRTLFSLIENIPSSRPEFQSHQDGCAKVGGAVEAAVRSATEVSFY
jgi:hypothetical protein